MTENKKLTTYFKKYLISFILGALCLIIVDFAQLEIPTIVGDIIDGINNGSKGLPNSLTKESLKIYVIKLIVIAFIVFGGRILWRIFIFGSSLKIERDIRNDMFKHMELLSQDYFHKNKTGEIMSLYSNDLGIIRNFFGSGTLMLVDALTLGVLAFVKMLKLNVKLALFSIVPLIIASAFAVLTKRELSKRHKHNVETFSKFMDFTEESFKGISVIKAFVREKRQEFLCSKYNKIDLEAAHKGHKFSVFINVMIGFILTFSLICIVFFGSTIIYNANVKGVQDSVLSVGKLTTFYAYFDSLIWPIMAVGDLINLSASSTPCRNRIIAFLNQEVEINNDLVDTNINSNLLDGSIKFNHLSFSYPNSDVTILKDITFEIKNGEFFGIMGKTGCGKSTLVELLLRLYNIPLDSIYISNYDIMKISLSDVRNLIAYVPQENFLYKDSILNNICFSMEEPDEEKALYISNIAGLSKDINDFYDGTNHGIKTVIGERGTTVSGGQKQRMSIARALIKDAQILILDDSLSAVDTITEHSILKSLREIRKGKTTIFVAHRITTLETLDRIAVLDDGKLIDVGTHNELKNRCELYKRETILQELDEEEDK